MVPWRIYVPGLGHQGENQVYSEKRIMHIAKGANLLLFKILLILLFKNNNIDVYSESGHEEFVKWVKDNKELINALGEQAEKNAITNMMGVAGMKSEEKGSYFFF